MDRLFFKMNGTDYSSDVQLYGFQFGYDRREGSNSGMMLDGTKTVDLIASKLVITVNFNPMSAVKAAQILSELQSAYVTVSYYDPLTTKGGSGEFIPSLGSIKYALSKPLSGARYFNGLTLTLTQR